MQLPHTFGRYTLLEKLAQGGMAEVYRARYAGAGSFIKAVAVKRILPAWSGDPQFVAMLIDEANALAYLQHQNIVQVYELGKEGDAYFISMEYVPGIDCRTLLRRLQQQQRRLAEPQALFIITEVLKGLAFAHAQTDAHGTPLGIVHRDISPQNILCSFYGEVKIADFGIAKGSHRHRQTQAAQVKGKYAYMAPEQACGQPVDARADLFAVGALLYELLTGQACFEGPNDLAIVEQVKQAALPTGWERQFPPVVRDLLRRSLAREAADRYPTAQAFLEAITRYTMTHRLLMHGLEWAETLRGWFPGEATRAVAVATMPLAGRHGTDGVTRADTALPRSGAPGAWRGWSILLRQGVRVLLAGAALGCLSMTTLARGDRTPLQRFVSLERHPGTRPPVPMPQAVILPTPPVDAVVVRSAPAPAPAIATRGALQIDARPWGEVTIPGVVSGREAPVYVQLAAGTYAVQISHRASGDRVSAKATVRSGARTACFATFGEKPSMRCR